MAISHNPSPHYYSRSVIVNFNNIFGFKDSAGITPDVLAPRILRETKSAFVREETIAPLLVGPVCVITTATILMAFTCWGNTFHRFIRIQANVIQTPRYGLP